MLTLVREFLVISTDAYRMFRQYPFHCLCLPLSASHSSVVCLCCLGTSVSSMHQPLDAVILEPALAAL